MLHKSSYEFLLQCLKPTKSTLQGIGMQTKIEYEKISNLCHYCQLSKNTLRGKWKEAIQEVSS